MSANDPKRTSAVAAPIPLLILKKNCSKPGALDDCRLAKGLLILTSNETKPIERLERIGNLEIN
jgi:hypothetical protein